MAKGMRFLESSATPEEDSYRYRVEWDDQITFEYDDQITSAKKVLNNSGKIKHHGSGSTDVDGFDNAWDVFNHYRDDPDFIGIRLIRIDSGGNEYIYASK